MLGLWAIYQKEGASFVPKLEAMLQAGGSESPLSTTQRVGIDITEKQFWQGAFEVVAKMLEQVEAGLAK